MRGFYFLKVPQVFWRSIKKVPQDFSLRYPNPK